MGKEEILYEDLMKYWIEKNQIFVVTSDAILFATYSKKVIEGLALQLDKNVIPNSLTGIPLNYIHSIQYIDQKKQLEFTLNKGSIEYVNFNNRVLAIEIFESLKSKLSSFRITKPKSSLLWKGYISLIGLMLLIILARIYLGDAIMNGQVYNSRPYVYLTFRTIFEVFNQQTIMIGASSIIIWRTFMLIKGLRDFKNNIRISRS